MIPASPLPRRSPSHQRWTLDDIPWQSLDRARVTDQELLFYLLTTASFIETATDTYAHNLIEYYAGDEETTTWLEQHWQHEELQHGRALKRYVQTAWPNFDWDQVYQAFFAEFSANCVIEALEPSRCLEMVSRCIVEMGTASYYTTLSRLSPEPVLRQLTQLIREDEIRHYKYFYHYFLRYRQRENMGRWKIFRAVLRRLRMIDGEDSSIALKHAYGILHSGAPFDNRLYRIIQKRARCLMGPQFPHRMSVKMTLNPLDLNPRVQKTVAPTIAFLSRYLLWGEGGMRIKSYGRMYTDLYTRVRVYALNQWARLAE
ncbi:MAG: ferritin-like domain-containing protein [Gammaproteobacteria bacterium]|nr:ferritin-like domain-containing protein [Gammaproteobacteria bacterium]MBU6509466.1 ferritin-like domain-containing protein [Gammaproteobacteria bacterium]MDE1983462.1 ferritin-like domain-containing protein [Gammaproteobacteria bacterium]MDE2108753.1 ferritin-like domain-containing protein [Gammaproteobacteria bacterium]MDE2461440.1 ferritin-like domain-containing protein [Gammaproteobacteria bacterium]